MKKYTQLIYAVVIGLIVVILVSRMFGGSSKYTLGPTMYSSDLMVKSNAGEPSEMQNLSYKLECVPGPQETASPYTKSLTPGGYCGIQEFVKSQADYVITGGIGESLLA
jgi:hypothetical protein